MDVEEDDTLGADAHSSNPEGSPLARQQKNKASLSKPSKQKEADKGKVKGINLRDAISQERQKKPLVVTR
jgi:hypothetical protein